MIFFHSSARMLFFRSFKSVIMIIRNFRIRRETASNAMNRVGNSERSRPFSPFSYLRSVLIGPFLWICFVISLAAKMFIYAIECLTCLIEDLKNIVSELTTRPKDLGT